MLESTSYKHLNGWRIIFASVNSGIFLSIHQQNHLTWMTALVSVVGHADELSAKQCVPAVKESIWSVCVAPLSLIYMYLGAWTLTIRVPEGMTIYGSPNPTESRDTPQSRRTVLIFLSRKPTGSSSVPEETHSEVFDTINYPHPRLPRVKTTA